LPTYDYTHPETLPEAHYPAHDYTLPEKHPVKIVIEHKEEEEEVEAEEASISTIIL